MNIQEANNDLIQIHIYRLMLCHFKKSASILTDQDTQVSDNYYTIIIPL